MLVGVLTVLKVYAQLARKAAARAARGWPVVFLLLAYPYLLAILRGALAPLGMLGGIIWALCLALAISSYLYFLAEVVNGTKVRVNDWRRSLTAHFSDTMSVLFSLWIIQLGLGVLTGGMGERGVAVRVLVGMAMVVFLNPLPEVIYQRRVMGGWFTHLAEAGRFILAHWPAWLIPNLLLGVAFVAPFGGLADAPAGARLLVIANVFSIDGLMAIILAVPLWLKPVLLLFIHFVMVWRGLLFEELSSGLSTRQRAFRDAWGRNR